MSTTLRVAVCSSDGRMVDEHFGTTVQFVILDVQPDSVRFVENRVNQPSCQTGGHNGGKSALSVALISDCQVLFTVRAGAPVLARLAAQGIAVHQTATSIAEAIETFRNGLASHRSGVNSHSDPIG